MTIQIQKANIWDKILGFFGKKRAVYLPPDSNGYDYSLARRENFFRALFRSVSEQPPEGWVYLSDIENDLSGDNNKPPIPPSSPAVDTEPKEQISVVSNFSRQKENNKGKNRPRHFKKTFIYFLAAFLSIWLLMFVGHSFIDSILDRIEHNKIVHPDKTTMSSGVTSEVNDKITLIYKNEKGELKRVVADRDILSPFADKYFKILEEERIKIRSKVLDSIKKDNDESFEPIYSRIDDYADWYFAYTTTYKILGKAISSATSHALEPSAMSLLDEVSLDVEKYLEEHYEKIVLKPEISDPILQENFHRNLNFAHEQFLTVMADLNTDFQKYVAENTSHLENVDESQIEIKIDWASQFHKVSMAGYEKGVGGSVVGVGLAAGGAFAGKAIGAAIGKGVASEVVASSAGKAMIAKLSEPFIAKAISLAGSTAAGATTGTVAGPAGTIIGAGIGFLVDYAINEGVELVKRDTFVRDARLAVESFENELNENEATSLQKAVDTWFDDSINLLKKFN